MRDLSNIRCVQCDVSNRGIFHTLEDDLIEKIDGEKKVSFHRPGQILFSEGMPCWGVCCIHSGAVKVYKLGERGEVQIIRVLGPSELVGLRPLVSNEPFAATVEALENTITCFFKRETIQDLIRRSETFANEIMAHLAQELRLSEEMLMAVTQRSVKRRAAYLLLWLYARDGLATREGISAGALLKKKEMAQIIGTSPETFSRTLKALAEAGLIDLTHRHIRLLDEGSLRAMATIGGTYI